MAYESKSRRKSYYENLKKSIGTKDFDRLDYSKELNAIEISMKSLKDDIFDLKQYFNTYLYD